ncbi:GTPase ObgE [Catenibacterium mitsuokai]|uniref:GTPase Obg n=1 Tax=Catenibacterium mitsuokai TaxID=100886 RepID=A0AAW4MUT6_9FIRM|nr:GTPase ObgE [Catenibacterium mitsuokai]MBV3366240.1 GTPase ObgE [Catenibacterium mitsuokai]MBV3370376.1 GTPase ObgE [Catenibacterium mitsuokai]MBV3375669.1 GTPase ObgE [Catenibacterium mitsuokai]MBV3378348.1 GTPase ObgE [Catenibacterium mitsuokai]MBV3380200.1 GTPase ObgE [Catenibacterium mitsuokai]
MKFIDRVKIYVQAGTGGNGTVAFRREAHVPKGGPSGGDGGRGGSVIFVATNSLSTLLDLRYYREYKAQNGEKGHAKKMHGADADDLVIRVPVGTCVYDDDTGNIIADLTKDGQRAVIAKGGRGGRGNARFASSRNPAPKICENGEPGEKFNLRVELKLLADVGLVGFPSVGKSTLLSVVSKARPQIADYHFTTIVPNLGVVQVKDGRSFVMADLPGLIEGASQGKGLGHQFLRHIERCRVIVHIIDMSGSEGRDPYEDYVTINKELGEYEYRLLERPQIIVANKMDGDEAEENLKKFKEKLGDQKVFPIIAPIHEGIDAVLYAVADALETAPDFFNQEEEQESVLYNYKEEEKPFTIHNKGNGVWEVTGKKVERLVQMASFTTDDGFQRFALQIRNMGIDDALREAGCEDGDTVRLYDFEFEFYN